MAIDDGGTPNDPSDDTVVYTPAPGFQGVDTFTYTIQDPDGNQDTASVTVSVGDAAPTALDDSDTTGVGIPVSIDVLANDSDPNGDPLTIVSATDPANGTATIDDLATPNDPSDDRIVYTPFPGFQGIDTFTYTIQDPSGNQATATVTVTVGDVTPLAVDDRATTDIDTPVAVDVLANDSDPNGDPLTIVSTTAPANGGVVVEDAGTPADPSDDFVTYTPNPGFEGVDTFTYTIQDPDGNQDTATVTVIVGNAPPVAVDDSATTLPGLAVSIPVLINDFDPDGDPLTITQVGPTTAGGTVEFSPIGTVIYTPPVVTSVPLVDTFTYEISDGNGGLATATVTVIVSDFAPTAVADMVITPPSTPIDIPVLDNDSDPNGDPLTVVETTDPPNGTAEINPTGTVTYTPDDGFLGSDTFTYTIEDPDGNSDTAIVTVLVTDSADMPNAVDDVSRTAQGIPVAIDVLANDSDPTNDPLTITTITLPGNGTVALDDGGTPADPSDDRIVYTPNFDFAGVDVFTYTIMDPDGNQDLATVAVTVTEPAALSGSVFLDINHDNVQQAGEPGLEAFVVELRDAAGDVLATSVTDDQGDYDIQPVAPGTNLRIVFVNPDGIVFGDLTEINLSEGQVLPGQDLPVDPSGIVYDSITRLPIAGAVVTLNDAGGNPLPTVCLLDPSQQPQTTGADGFYRFDVVPGADAACPVAETQYTIAVVSPPGFDPAPSAILPETAGGPLDATTCPVDTVPGNGVCEVGASATQPQPGDLVQYFFSFLIAQGDDDVVDNHIPLDSNGTLGAQVLVTKVANKREVSVGDVLFYTLSVTNQSGVPIAAVEIRDDPPSVFTFADGSARLIRDGADPEPIATVGTDPIVFGPFALGIGETVELTYVLLVGDGLVLGSFENSATPFINNVPVGNTAVALVDVVADPVFEQTDGDWQGLPRPRRGRLAGFRLCE